MADKIADIKPALRGGRRKTRERLLDAGLKLFASKGYDGTAIRDLEEAAGLKPGSGSFYRHFPDKDSLFEEVIGREIQANRQRSEFFEQALAGSLGDTRAELVLQLRGMLLGLEQMADFMNILAREGGRAPELMAEVSEALIDQSRQSDALDLQQKVMAGEVVDLDVRALSAIVHSTMIGHFMARQYFGGAPGGVGDDLLIATLADLLTGAGQLKTEAGKDGH